MLLGRLQVRDWRSIYGIQFCHHQQPAIHGYQLADGAPDSIGPVLPLLREDSDNRPVLVASRMAGAGDDLLLCSLVKVEHFPT
jgi:hypothetical protein